MVKVDEISFYKDETYRINDEVGSNEWILMQFTGAYDCDKNEVYEGDILDFGDDEIYAVEWIDYDCGWGFSDGILFSGGETHHSKIIGNVYENPKILYLQ